MKIGVLKEIKDKENRVALTPEGAKILAKEGHTVFVSAGAGVGSGFADEEYQAVGAEVVKNDQAWEADIVMKVKEPLESEYQFLNGQMLFTYLHLAGVTKTLTARLLETKTTGIAYETVEDQYRRLPLLAPMSAIAGNMAVHVGSFYLAKFNEGKGVLIVDDLVDTGRTAKIVRKILPKAHFATVYAKPMGRPMVDTFVTEVSQDTWIYFPWDTGLAFVPPIREGGD